MRCLILLWWWWLATFTECLIHAEFQLPNIFSKHTQYFVFHIFCISEEGHSDVMSPLYAREFVLHSSPIQLARPKRERIVRWPVVLICALHSTLIFSYCCVRYTQNDQLWWWVSECPMSIRYARTLIQHHVLCVYMCSVNMHLFQLFFFFLLLYIHNRNFTRIFPHQTGLLFHRAILMSGSGLAPWSLVHDPAKYAAIVSHHVNCSPELPHSHLMKCLRERPLEALLSTPIRQPEFGNAFGPSVDGVVIGEYYTCFQYCKCSYFGLFFIIFLVCLVTRLRTCFIANLWNKNSHVS